MKDELNRKHDERPWGSFDQFTENQSSTVKILRVASGHRLSLQRHKNREEFWHCISGSGTAEIDGVSHPLIPGTELLVPKGSSHRLSANEEGVEILEIAFGQFDEYDIERLEDDYGRTAS